MNKKHIVPFWVGFLDGDGSIQVNHWRKKSIQYRFVIKIKNSSKNVKMCETFKSVLGGTVRLEKPLDKNVIWVEDHQRNIWKLVEILEKIPPLTHRLQCQLNFCKNAKKNGVAWMLENREFKYLQPRKTVSYKCKPIWHFWLCGFIEAKGCFRISPSGNISFSIGQKGESLLLSSIRDYFGGTNLVCKKKNDFYFWKVYREDVCKKICISLENCLIGEKNVSYKIFCKSFI